MKRDDPSTWVPFTEEEEERYANRPEGGGDPYFYGHGHRLYTRNGAEELLLNTAVRSLWDVAEQLLGEGEVVWPAGVDQAGVTMGPCLMTEGNVQDMETHLGPEAEAWETDGKSGGATPTENGPGLVDRAGFAGSLLHVAQ